MKKILLGFLGGLFVAFIIHSVWVVNTVNNINSKLPEGLRQESIEPILLKRFEEAVNLFQASLIDRDNGNTREQCRKINQGIEIIRDLPNKNMSNLVKDWKSFVKEMEDMFKKACP